MSFFQFIEVRTVVMMQRRLQNHKTDRTKNQEATHDDPKNRPALLTFALFKGITAVAGVASRTLRRAHFQKITELGENFLRIDSDKARIRAHESTDEWLCGKFGILIGFQKMKDADTDLRRRRDLLDRDPTLFALLLEEFA